MCVFVAQTGLNARSDRDGLHTLVAAMLVELRGALWNTGQSLPTAMLTRCARGGHDNAGMRAELGRLGKEPPTSVVAPMDGFVGSGGASPARRAHGDTAADGAVSSHARPIPKADHADRLNPASAH